MKITRKQQGVGLIEVLVASVIMAIGILGYAGMQVQTLGESTNAQHRMQALALAGDLVARVRANNSQLKTYLEADFSVEPANVECPQSICDAKNRAMQDIKNLHQHLDTLLPDAQMDFVKCFERDTHCVRIAWNGSPATQLQCDEPKLNKANNYEAHCVSLEVYLW